MKFKSRVTKFGKQRKIIEIPKNIRDEYSVGELVCVEKVSVEKKCYTEKHTSQQKQNI